MSDLSMLINGLKVTAEKNATFERRNPLDGSVATRAPAASPADAVMAVEAAAEAFKTWSQTGPGERRMLLLKAAEKLEAKLPQFAEAVAAETGATGMWAGFNVMLAAGMIREAASLTTQITGEVIPSDVPGSLAMGVRQPAGVVLGIAPWNAPIILGVRAIATPLACGNTVVFKGSENCPRTHQLIAEAFQEAGFPPGVLNYITNAPADAGAVVEAVVAHPAVRRVNFTGSTKVGRIIAMTCAKYLKPVVLELGGKAPLVILDDADVEDAVNGAAFGCFANSGQICMSTERIIVDQKVADEFVKKFAAKAGALPLGDPRKSEPVVLGSVIGMNTVQHCNALIDDALAKGAKLLCGGKAETTLMPATVLDHVTPKMRIYHEETFGPVKCVVRVKDTEEAIACANDNEYGLAAAVFGRDIARAFNVARRIDSGICHDEAQMPFGGVKGSGMGRFGGKAGIAEFTDLRWITVQTTPRHYPF
ncbi:MAG: aldehyde dehydrogenase [Ramlibacter sp.]